MTASTNPRAVLVTGASSGIGQAIARHLAARGWRVFGTSRREAASFDGVNMAVIDADDDQSASRAVAFVVEKTGRLDAVVNNAGWALMGPIEDTSIAAARAQLETNFFGVLRVCRAALPIMRAQRAGHVVNVSSLAGVFGMPFSGIYSASKFAPCAGARFNRLRTRALTGKPSTAFKQAQDEAKAPPPFWLLSSGSWLPYPAGISRPSLAWLVRADSECGPGR